jgi:dTDP-4-dehydrorhamnose 3,5-epimerase
LQLIPTTLNDVVILEPKVFGDKRGFFLEAYNEATFKSLGLPTHFVQDNHSGSRKGVLRGLHYQLQRPQGKLVRTLAGEIFDVAVDLRQGSPLFGQWVGVVLNSENRRSLWVPPGFGHGFLVLSEFAEVSYKTTDFYAPEYEHTILWSDPTIDINWPLDGEAILSEKDKAGLLLANAETYPTSSHL